MESLESRVLVVGVDGDMGDGAVFEKLHEVYGEEAFADAALPVDDSVNSLLHSRPYKFFESVMWGPRLRGDQMSGWLLRRFSNAEAKSPDSLSVFVLGGASLREVSSTVAALRFRRFSFAITLRQKRE